MKLSIVIPVYNGRRFLRSAVMSALAEAEENTEVIVVDDGSTDGSLEEIADLNVVSIQLPRNSGPSRARNEGIRLARGRYIAFLDSDDILSENSLHWRTTYLDNHPEHSAISGLVEYLIDDVGDRMSGVSLICDREPSQEIVIDKRFYQEGGSIGQVLSTTLFRRNLFEKIGHFDETLRLAEDIDLYLRAIAHSPIPLVFQPAIRYRIHAGNMSKKQSVVNSERAVATARLVFLSQGYHVEFKKIPAKSYSIYQRAAP